MTALIVGFIVILSLTVAMLGLVLVARRARRTGGAGPAIGAAMAAYDEAMHSTAHDSYLELRAEEDRTIPAPSPDNA